MSIGNTATLNSTTKLLQDFSTLVNNPFASDVCFLVGGGDEIPAESTSNDGRSSSSSSKSTSSGKSTSGKSVVRPTNSGSLVATFHAHSLILRLRSKYFANMLNEHPEWKDSACKIRKPYISAVVFGILLKYVYTGDMEISDPSLLPEVIASAEDMQFDELSISCQSKLIAGLEDSVKEGQPKIPFDVAVPSLLVPGLIISSERGLIELFEKLLSFTFEHLRNIIGNTRRAFLEKVPLTIFKQILSADTLDLEEYDVWQLALDWACHQTKVAKSTLDAQLRLRKSVEADREEEAPREEVSPLEAIDHSLISERKLNELKAKLVPLIPAIRFTLMDKCQYISSVESFNEFLSQRYSQQLKQFFSTPDAIPQDSQRITTAPSCVTGSVIINSELALCLRKWIFSTNAITGCSTEKSLRFGLLYRGSLHGFQVSMFHQLCDSKGPTLTLVKATTGHIFGGVNFSSWSSANDYSTSTANFVFALKDGRHRVQSEKFKVTNVANAAHNTPSYGPAFGAYDFIIANQANLNNSSYSNMPHSYDSPGVSNTTLAGSKNFKVSEYEVYAITV